MSATTEQRAKELWELAEQVNLVAQAMIARAWDSGYAAGWRDSGTPLARRGRTTPKSAESRS